MPVTLLSETERRKILVEFNQTERPHLPAVCVHQIIRRRSERAPDAVAVIDRVKSLTYAQLERQSNQWAYLLRKRGVQSETIVGLSMPRSADLVVGMLAVAKAGGAYLPLDPDYPSARIQYMLADSGAACLLTNSGDSHGQDQIELPGALNDIDVIDMTRMAKAAAGMPCQAPRWEYDLQDLAYIIYTSGSTGNPQGVMVPHRALHNHMCWLLATFEFDQDERILQKTPFSFDASVWEFYGALMAGGKLIMAHPDAHKSGAALMEEVIRHKVTTLQVVPTQLQWLVDQPGMNAASSLRRVFSGGEKLTEALRDRFVEKCDAELVNLYGPTEVCINATFCRVSRKKGDRISIGKPVDNTQAYVLGEDRQPVAIGAFGELWLGGIQVARGYLRGSEQTAGRFVPDSFSGDPESRLYRTGDICRWLSSGELEYSGRNDQQIKYNGVRIELGEIEFALLKHPFVAEAVAMILDDSATGEGYTEKKLVAYVVLKQSIDSASIILRSDLHDRLPDAMVPSGYIVLDELPLLPNGKIDRKTLSTLAPAVSVRDVSQYVAPHTPTQQTLVDIWENGLELSRIGIDDDFFDVGGHSLLAARLMLRVQRELNKELPVKSIFESPTIRDLAEMVDRQPLMSAPTTVKSPLPNGSTPETPGDLRPASFGQRRFWFTELFDPDSIDYNVIRVYDIDGDLNISALEQTLEFLFERHEILRTILVPINGVPFQRVLPSSSITIPIEDLRELDTKSCKRELERQLRREIEAPIRLETCPSWYFRLFQLAERKYVWSLTISHAIFDNWSLGVLTREISECYSNITAGRAPDLPPLPAQYADFAAWQDEHLCGGKFQGHLTYWMEKLASVPDLLELPTDFPRPARRSGEGATVSHWLASDVEKALPLFLREQRSTLFVTLLTVFKCLLHQRSRQRTIVVGTPIANRSAVEFENLIGLFLNTLALRTDIRDDVTFGDTLRDVRQHVLEAFSHQDLPFEQLVDQLNPPRNLSHSPVFQVMFTVVDAHEKSLSLVGADVSVRPVTEETSKFDLTMFVRESSRGIEVFSEFDIALFRAETIERLHMEFEAMLRRVMADPDCLVGELCALSSIVSNRHFQPGVLHELVEKQVCSIPEQTALVCGSECLTFRELDERANRIAHFLLENGLEQQSRVAICLPRGWQLYATILGVLKAGAACVPMDPAQPLSRLEILFENAQPQAAVIADSTFALSSVPSLVLDFNCDWEAIANSPPQSPNIRVSSDAIAYILYTSGSTGIPKGVAMPHGPIANLVDWQKESTLLAPSATTAQFANVTFDVAFQEMFFAWSSGATLVVVEQHARYDPQELLRLLTQQRVERLFIPFVALSNLAAAANSHFADDSAYTPLALREVITAGEQPIVTETIRAFFQQLDGASLHNQYGPTESHVVTCHTLTGDPAFWPHRPPIGLPINGARIYLLDEDGKICSRGDVGELTVGGECLARGYYNNSESNALSFVDDPFGAGRSPQMYKTGDLASITQDGTIQYLGRADDQVKFRGYRIESGEIEAVLNQHADVEQAVVVLDKGDDSTPPQLVAYVAPVSKTTSDAFREYLAHSLPDYMVPAIVQSLDGLPLTATGKIDRRSLPRITRKGTLSPGVQPPSDFIERQVIEWYQELLGVESIGLQDDFFALGGHSLLAAQLFSYIRTRFHIQLPLSILFAESSVASVAEAIRQQDSAVRNAVSLSAGGSGRPLFVMPSMSGDVLIYRELVQHLDPDVAVFGVLPFDKNKPQRFETLPEFVTACLQAMRAVQPNGPYRIAGYSFAGIVGFEAARQLVAAGERVEFLAMLDAGFLKRPDSIGAWIASSPRMIANFPRWVREDIVRASPRRIIDLLRFKIRSWMQPKQDGKSAAIEMQQWCDVEQLPDSLRETIECHYRAFKRYKTQPYLGDMTVFRASARPLTDISARDSGWSRYVEGNVHVHIIPGNHETFMRSPLVGILADQLHAHLASLSSD